MKNPILTFVGCVLLGQILAAQLPCDPKTQQRVTERTRYKGELRGGIPVVGGSGEAEVEKTVERCEPNPTAPANQGKPGVRQGPSAAPRGRGVTRGASPAPGTG